MESACSEVRHESSPIVGRRPPFASTQKASSKDVTASRQQTLLTAIGALPLVNPGPWASGSMSERKPAGEQKGTETTLDSSDGGLDQTGFCCNY